MKVFPRDWVKLMILACTSRTEGRYSLRFWEVIPCIELYTIIRKKNASCCSFSHLKDSLYTPLSICFRLRRFFALIKGLKGELCTRKFKKAYTCIFNLPDTDVKEKERSTALRFYFLPLCPGAVVMNKGYFPPWGNMEN